MDQEWLSYIESIEEYFNEGENLYAQLLEAREENTDYIVCPGHIGDTIWMLALAESYIREHNCDRVFYVVRKSQWELTELFPKIEGSVILEEDEMDKLVSFITAMQYWNREHIVYAHFTAYLVLKYPSLQMVPTLFDLKNTETMHERREEILGITRNVSYSKMLAMDSGENKELQELFGKAVLLLPAAQKMKMLPMDFWKELAEKYKNLGYEVYTNYNRFPYEQVVPGTKPLASTVGELAQLGPYFAQVISLRSGACELLAETETNLSIVFNQKIKEARVRLERMEIEPEGIYELTDRENIRCFQYVPGLETDLEKLLIEQL